MSPNFLINKLICKIVFLFILISDAYSQNKPSIDQTEQWIIDKISEYAYSNNDVSNTYKVSIPMWNATERSGLMQIEAFSYHPFTGNVRTFSTINIMDIRSISFQRKDSNYWMYIRLNDVVDQTWNSSNVRESKYASLILSNRIIDDNMINRFNRAFKDLVEFYGGKFQSSTDVY